MRIVIDIRRIRDFGVGTYIRNLVPALSLVDRENEYLLVRLPADAHELPGLGPNFRNVFFEKTDADRRFRASSVRCGRTFITSRSATCRCSCPARTW